MVNKKRAKIRGSPPTLVTKSPSGEDKTVESSRFIRLLGGNLQEDLTRRGQLELGKKLLLPGLRTKIGALKMLVKNIPEERSS